MRRLRQALAVRLESKMNGILELEVLIKNMHPEMSENEYVFCTAQSLSFEAACKLNPICAFREDEGLTLVLEKACAESEKLHFDEVFKKITLQVHSSLKAVALTAAVSTALADKGISANLIAAFYHDHIFVSKNKSVLALKVLLSLSQGS
jgi:hypothetical protein